MEYIIYFDESVNDGEYYSDFFGGVLVRNTDYDVVRCALDTMKQELNLNGEIKWIKVTANYLEKYKQIMNLFFSYIKGNRLKVRIMFRETSQTPSNLSAEQIHNRYSLLYYQFVKNAFGLIYHDSSDRTQTFLRLYFDEIPYPLDQRDSFKSHILSSASLPVPQSSPKDSHGRCSGNRLQKARNSTMHGCCFGLYFLHA